MALPSMDEFLTSLTRMRSEGIQARDEALAKGDIRLAGSFDALVSKIEKMILQKGGSLG